MFNSLSSLSIVGVLSPPAKVRVLKPPLLTISAAPDFCHLQYNLLFIAACHAVSRMLYSLLIIATGCTVSHFLPCALQFTVCHCTVQHNFGGIGYHKLLNNRRY